MSKLATRFLIISILVCMPYTVFALPGVHNPTLGGFKCSTCHNASATIGAESFNNTCTSCHRVGGTAPSGGTYVPVKNVFSPGDFANPYKTYTGAVPGRSYQTSHKWTGKDVVPQAGALAPTDPYNTTAGSLDTSKGMNKASLVGSVTCARCHNVHGDSALSSVNPPYLRSINDKDQMCLDCHRDRDKPSYIYGTHAVNVSYTSAKVKLKNADTVKEYLPLPLTNPANPTAQIKLVNGMLLCSSCHGVHYTDSNSRTFDNRSSAKLNNLSTSTGTLLRVDARGSMSSDGITFTPNICTNCHIGINHSTGNKKANVQCDDCHSGHVEYIKPEDKAAGEGTPNVFLLRRYVNYSGGVKLTGPNAYRRKVFLITTSNQTAILLRPDGKGICQGCHTPPAIVPEHATTTVASQCAPCHSSGVATIGAIAHYSTPPIGCTGCHGSPPQASTAGGPNGYANDITTGHNYAGAKDESLTGHKSHSASLPYNYYCNECHQGNDHNTGTFTDVFINKAGLKASLNGSVPAYVSNVNGTCSTVYCHSNGNPSNMKYKAVNWGLARSTYAIVGTANECIACHNGVVGTFNNLSTNSHFKHVSNSVATGKGYGCNICHSSTVSDNSTISNTANHVNGVRNVTFSGTAAGSIWNGATCTSSCHLSATPTWTNRSTGACGTCHAATSPMIATNAHFTHLSTATANPWGPDLSGVDTVLCAKCHTYTGELGASHVNGTIDAPAANCTATCHRNSTPTWTSAIRLNCETCHDGNISYDSRPGFNNISAPRKVMTTFTTNGHGKYNAYYCTNCHNNATKHITGTRGDSNRLGVYENAQNNLCVTCHNNNVTVPNPARNNMLTHVADYSKVYPPAGLCSGCHDVHGTSNYASVMSKIQFNSLSSAVTISYPVTGLNYVSATPGSQRGFCQVCHTKTNHFRRDMPESGAGTGWSGSGISHTGFNNSTNCLTCHKHNVGLFAFSPSGGACNACHGYPPVTAVGSMARQNNYSTALLQNYSGGGGAHTVAGHLPASVKASNGWNVDCNKCHYNTSHTMDTSVWSAASNTATRKTNVSVTVDPQYKFNTTETLDNSRYVKATSANSGACSNVSCHFQSTPRWATDK